VARRRLALLAPPGVQRDGQGPAVLPASLLEPRQAVAQSGGRRRVLWAQPARHGRPTQRSQEQRPEEANKRSHAHPAGGCRGTTPGRGGAPEVLRHGTADTTQVWPRGSCAAGASKFSLSTINQYIIYYILHIIYISQSTKFKENISELRTINIIKISHYLNNIIVCRSLLNLGLGGAAPGITAGV
jgi:hypothetical protein